MGLKTQSPKQRNQRHEAVLAFDDMAASDQASRNRAEDQWLAVLLLLLDGGLRLKDVSDQPRACVDRRKPLVSLHP